MSDHPRMGTGGAGDDGPGPGADYWRDVRIPEVMRTRVGSEVPDGDRFMVAAVEMAALGPKGMRRLWTRAGGVVYSSGIPMISVFVPWDVVDTRWLAFSELDRALRLAGWNAFRDGVDVLTWRAEYDGAVVTLRRRRE